MVEKSAVKRKRHQCLQKVGNEAVLEKRGDHNMPRGPGTYGRTRGRPPKKKKKKVIKSRKPRKPPKKKRKSTY